MRLLIIAALAVSVLFTVAALADDSTIELQREPDFTISLPVNMWSDDTLLRVTDYDEKLTATEVYQLKADGTEVYECAALREVLKRRPGYRLLHWRINVAAEQCSKQ